MSPAKRNVIIVMCLGIVGIVLVKKLHVEPPVDAKQRTEWISQIVAGDAQPVSVHLEKILKQRRELNDRIELVYVLSRARIKTSDRSADAVEEFIRLAPNDARGQELLFRLGAVGNDPKQRIATYQRAIERDPESKWAAPSRGAIRRIEELGKPFNLTFLEASTGKEISIQRDMKGKVVVIDFWAGWCGDCAAEMPRLKSIYDKYHDKGVEFVGISLDKPESEGGLRTMTAAVARLGIPWPQFYQGNYTDSDFSAGWGINSIPWAFVLDRQGNLASADALKTLDETLSQLVAGPGTNRSSPN